MRGRSDLSQFQDMETEVAFTCIVNVTVKCQADIYFTFFSERYGNKDLELSYLIASYCVQNPTEYIDIIETSDTQTQTAGQVAD